LKMLVGNRSVVFFARKCGLAESVLRTYLNDGRMPSLDKGLAVATAGGVTLDWLATGRGRRFTADATATLDTAVLEGILKAVLEAHGDRATPERLATLTVDLYQRAMTLEPRE